VNLEKLGYSGMGFIMIKLLNKDKMPDIYAQVCQIPNVIVARRLKGTYDLRLIVALKDARDITQQQEKINNIRGIEKYEITIHKTFPAWPVNLYAPLLFSMPGCSNLNEQARSGAER